LSSQDKDSLPNISCWTPKGRWKGWGTLIVPFPLKKLACLLENRVSHFSLGQNVDEGTRGWQASEISPKLGRLQLIFPK